MVLHLHFVLAGTGYAGVRAFLPLGIGCCAHVKGRHKVEVRRDLHAVPPRAVDRYTDDHHREDDTDAWRNLCT